MPTVRVLTNISKGRITVQPVVPFFDGNNLVTRARIPFTIGAGGETLIAIAPSAVVLYEFRVLDERDVVVWVSRLAVPSSTQIINLRDIASVPLPGEDPAIAIGINLLSEQLLDNAQFLADLEAAIGSGTVDLSNYPTFAQGDARYYQHGETIADIDIPGTIARDSELTGAITAHEASRNHPLATTSAAGLLSGADKTKIDGIDTALNAKLNASLLNANNGAAGLNASGKHLQAQALASAVMYTPATGAMAFTWADGSSQAIDLPIENLLQAANYDPATQTLSVTTAGGATIPIPLATLVDLPEIVISISDPAITPSSGQRLYFRSDTGEYWVSTGSAWSGKYLAFTASERSRLAGIATGATANATDAALRDRTSHTGVQSIATVDGLQTALDARPTLTIADGRYRLQSVALADNDIPGSIARDSEVAAAIAAITPASIGAQASNARLNAIANEVAPTSAKLAQLGINGAITFVDPPSGGGAADWGTLANRPTRLLAIANEPAPAETRDIQLLSSGAIAFAVPQGWNYLQSATAPTTRPDSSALQDNDRWLQPAQQGQTREWYRRRGIWTPLAPEIQITECCLGPNLGGVNNRINQFQTYGSGSGQVLNTQQSTLWANGIWSIDAGTVANNIYGLRLGNSLRLANFNLYARWVMATPFLSNATDKFDLIFGLSNATPWTGIPANGAYFRYTDDVFGGNWEASAVQAGTHAQIDTGSPVSTGNFSNANDFFTLELQITPGNSRFWINNIEVASINLQPTVAVSFIAGQIRKLAGTAARGPWLDTIQLDVWRI